MLELSFHGNTDPWESMLFRRSLFLPSNSLLRKYKNKTHLYIYLLIRNFLVPISAAVFSSFVMLSKIIIFLFYELIYLCTDEKTTHELYSA